MVKIVENNKKNNIVAKNISKIDDVLQLIDLELHKRGWKRGDLAKSLNKTESWLSNIMNKKRGLSVQTILDIAKILDIDPACLLPGGNPTKQPDLEDYIKKIVKEYLDERERESNNK